MQCMAVPCGSRAVAVRVQCSAVQWRVVTCLVVRSRVVRCWCWCGCRCGAMPVPVLCGWRASGVPVVQVPYRWCAAGGLSVPCQAVTSVLSVPFVAECVVASGVALCCVRCGSVAWHAGGVRVPCVVVRFSVVWCGTARCCTMRCSSVTCGTARCSAARYSAVRVWVQVRVREQLQERVRRSAVLRCNAVWCKVLPCHVDCVRLPCGYDSVWLRCGAVQ